MENGEWIFEISYSRLEVRVSNIEYRIPSIDLSAVAPKKPGEEHGRFGFVIGVLLTKLAQ